VIHSDFYFWNTILLLTYAYIEIFYSLIFISIYRGLKSLTLEASKKTYSTLFKNTFFLPYMYLLVIYVITLKLDFSDSIIPSLLILVFVLSNLMNKHSNTNFMFLNFNIFFFLIFIMYINSIVVLFIYIELYALLFYFIFLNIKKDTNTLTLLNLKNSLLLYLFNNFFTTILFMFSIYVIVITYGTVNLTELSYLYKVNSSNYLIVLLITFALKLALPGYHYIKLEIYKYLSFENAIYFSTITLIINYMFIMYFLNFNFVIEIMLHYKLLLLSLVTTFFFFIQKLQVSSLCEFIAYSGFATTNLIILSFLA
jgi:hypothetical protein